MEVLLGAEHVVVGRLHLAPHAREALDAGLQVGHADHVVVRHRHRDPARGFERQRMAVGGAAGRAARRMQARHALEVLARIRGILVVGHARQPLAEQVPRLTREGAADAFEQRLQHAARAALGQRARCGLHRLDRRPHHRRWGLAGQLRSGTQRCQTVVDADAGLAHHLLERGKFERQFAAAGQRTEQAGRDHAAVAHRERLHVGDEQTLGLLSHQGLDARSVGHAVARCALLGHRKRAVAARDHRGAAACHQAALQRTAGFHQLGGDHDVDVARRGHQRHHRLLVALPLDQLHVIDGGPGALRHAGHRRGLRPPAGTHAERDDPIDQHAAALAAEGEDRDVDRARLVHCGSSSGYSARLARCRCSARRIQLSSVSRSSARMRSKVLGLRTVCAL